MSDDELTLAEKFQRTANEPLAWFYTAETLASAALSVKESDDERGGGRLLEDFGQMTGRRSVYAMLLGYAVECAIKGMYVKAGHEIAGSSGALHNIHGFKSHHLRMMAETTKIDVSEDESKALDWLSGYVKHLGRYPIPLKARDLEVPIGFGYDVSMFADGSTKIHSTDEDNLRVAEALLSRLLEELKPKKAV